MFKRDLLSIVRPSPSDASGLAYAEGTEENGLIISGTVRSPSGMTYAVENGYLDLLGRRTGAHSPANLTNLLPGAGPSYEPLWRRRSLALLTGEPFSNEREIGLVSGLAGVDDGGLYLDLGCSGGLYTRNLSRRLGNGGDIVGVDISPTMLKEAARRCRRDDVSLARADIHHLPFADGAFSGAVCGGTLNELGDPARALREVRRVLRPDGRLAIMGILNASTTKGHRLQRLLSTGGLRFFDPDELASLLDHAGLATEELYTYGPVFFAGATRR